jgi:oligopeptide transport system permease protein
MKRLDAKLALIWILTITGLSLLSPWVSPFGYETQDLGRILELPGSDRLFGTDHLGRDLFSRILWGGRLSLALGVGTALASLLIGSVTGAVAGWLGGWVDRVIMRIVDFIYIFPAVLQAVLLMMILGRGFWGIFIALVLSTWTFQARLIRSLVLQIREFPHVESARALGIPPFRIILRHVLPVMTGPVIAALTIQIPSNIMAESFLSFLGLGFQPPHSSWGTLANEGFRAIKSYPHLILFPGLVLFFTMAALSVLGDSLSETGSAGIRSRSMD